jgi:hypothetical protein
MPRVANEDGRKGFHAASHSSTVLVKGEIFIVPEHGMWVLLALGFGNLAARRRRR